MPTLSIIAMEPQVRVLATATVYTADHEHRMSAA